MRVFVAVWVRAQPGLLQLVPAKGGGAARQPSGALPSPGGALLLSEASGAHEGGAGWLGDVFFADGAEGVRLSELKKALADAGWLLELRRRE